MWPVCLTPPENVTDVVLPALVVDVSVPAPRADVDLPSTCGMEGVVPASDAVDWLVPTTDVMDVISDVGPMFGVDKGAQGVSTRVYTTVSSLWHGCGWCGVLNFSLLQCGGCGLCAHCFLSP